MRAFEVIHQIINFILEPRGGWFFLVRDIFIGAILLMVGFIIWALIKTDWLSKLILTDLKEFLSFKASEISEVEKKWREISRRMERNIEAEAKLAILEADELLGKALSNAGYKGETFSSKLEAAGREVLPEISMIKEMHKLRNDIVADPSFHLSLQEAKRVIAVYKKALEDLGTL